MTSAITLWLAFVLACGLIGWTGTRRQALAFALVAILTAPATLLPLGRATPLKPLPGHYTVLGHRIDVDVAIYVLLDDGQGEPRLYRLPYTTATANELQAASDMTVGQEGGSVGMTMGEDGSPGFTEEGGAGNEPPKPQAERSLLQ